MILRNASSAELKILFPLVHRPTHKGDGQFVLIVLRQIFGNIQGLSLIAEFLRFVLNLGDANQNIAIVGSIHGNAREH